MGRIISVSFLLAILIVLISFGWSDGASPCNKIVKIESRELYSYLANVTFSAPKSFKGKWTLNLHTSVPFLFLGGWGGITINEDGPNSQAEIQSVNDDSITAGQSINFRFRISWSPYDVEGQVVPIPMVDKITWEGKSMCDSVQKRNVIRELYLLDMDNTLLKKPQYSPNSIAKMRRRNRYQRKSMDAY